MRLLLCLLLLIYARGAVADQLYVFVGVKCLPEQVEVKFERGWNEAGKKILSARVPNRWHTDELRKIASADDVHFETTPQPKSVHCQIAGADVRVLVEPKFAPHWHPIGNCAERTGAKVNIYRGSVLVGTEGLDACTELGDVPTSITVPASGALNITRMSSQEFIYGS